jgi:subtilisin family serine protease
MSEEYISEYYQPFGVKTFHDAGFYGKIKAGPLINTKIKVYIIDSGFDDANPSLPGIQTNVDLSTVTVRNFSNSLGSPEAPSHGSLTCALVAAPINEFGIVGVCPDARVFLGDVDNANSIIYQTNVVNAINDAVLEGADIISISLGSEEYTSDMQTAIQTAVAAGIYVFASAGNSGFRQYEYPASFPGVISVGSVNLDKQLSTFNTKNELVDIFAPGEDYYLPSSVGPVLADGTSFSCPFAAGLWALQLSRERGTNPTYKPTVEEAITILRSATHLDNGTLGYEALADPEELSSSTLTSIGLIVGGLIIIGLVVYAIMSLRQASAARKVARQEEIERKCALTGNC